MGAVYKARQISLNRYVAIKILVEGADTALGSFVERFQREARALARLTHPNIVTIHDFGYTSSGRLFIAMEYVDGDSLENLMLQGGLTTADVLCWIPQICDALKTAHEEGIIHRDIKPSNILISKSGQLKVADFGLATNFSGDSSTLTVAGTAVGTPEYIAPELFEAGCRPDSRSDIYSLGVLLYQLLTGRLPKGAWNLPSEELPGLDKRFDRIVLRALDPNPNDRYQSADDISGEIHEIASNPNFDDQGILERSRNFSPFQKVTLVVVLLGFGVASVYLTSQLFMRTPSQLSSDLSKINADEVNPVRPKRESEGAAHKESIADIDPAPENSVRMLSPVTHETEKEVLPLPESLKESSAVSVSSTHKKISPDEVVPKSAPVDVEAPRADAVIMVKTKLMEKPSVEAVQKGLEEIEARYKASYEIAVEPWEKAAYSNLNLLYRQAVERELQRHLRPAGNQSELTELLLSEISQIPEFAPVPNVRESSISILKPLRQVYLTEMAKIEEERNTKLLPILTEKLDGVEKLAKEEDAEKHPAIIKARAEVTKIFPNLSVDSDMVPNENVSPQFTAPFLLDAEIDAADLVLKVTPTAESGTFSMLDSLQEARKYRGGYSRRAMHLIALSSGEFPGPADDNFHVQGGGIVVPGWTLFAGNKSVVKGSVIMSQGSELRGIQCDTIHIGNNEVNSSYVRLFGCRFNKLIVAPASECSIINCLGSVELHAEAKIDIQHSTIVPQGQNQEDPAIIMAEDSEVTISESIVWSEGELFRIESTINRSRLKSGVFYSTSASLARDEQGANLVPSSTPDALDDIRFLVSEQWLEFKDPMFINAGSGDFRVSPESPAHMRNYRYPIPFGARLDKAGWPIADFEIFY